MSAVTVERPASTDPASERLTATELEDARASAYGTEDLYCHVMAGSAPYTRTRCGLELFPALSVEQTHAEPPCPNANIPCAACLT